MFLSVTIAKCFENVDFFFVINVCPTKNTCFRNFSQACICTLRVTSSPELSQGVCLKYDELVCMYNTSETHKRIHLLGIGQQSRRLAVLVCATTALSDRARELSRAIIISHCGNMSTRI